MSRMRQIPIMDVRQQERMLQQNQSTGANLGGTCPPMCHPPMYNHARPVSTGCKPRMRKPPAVKFRLSDAPALISTGCSSVRQLCSNVQNITVDLNNLIGSVESMLPLLNTYLTVMQSRCATQEAEIAPPIDVTARECPGQMDSAPHCTEHTCPPPPKEHAMPHAPSHSAASSNTAAPMPHPEDIQALLENPLVRNLLNGFMQNSAFPNINATKDNALRQ